MGDLVRYFLEHEVANVYVADGEGRFAGAVSIHDIKAPEFHDLGPVVLARDVAELNPQALVPTDTLADSMNRFLLSRDDELPVVDGDGRLVGVVSRGDVLRVYSTDLLRHEYLGVAVREQGPDDFRRLVRVGPGLTMALVPTPPWLRGRSLRDVNLRAAFDLTVVAIRHRGEGEAQLPDPEAPLNATDVLVVVGKSADIDRLRDPQPAQGANA
jgi:hypothetical protein